MVTVDLLYQANWFSAVWNMAALCDHYQAVNYSTRVYQHLCSNDMLVIILTFPWHLLKYTFFSPTRAPRYQNNGNSRYGIWIAVDDCPLQIHIPTHDSCSVSDTSWHTEEDLNSASFFVQRNQKELACHLQNEVKIWFNSKKKFELISSAFGWRKKRQTEKKKLQ